MYHDLLFAPLPLQITRREKFYVGENMSDVDNLLLCGTYSRQLSFKFQTLCLLQHSNFCFSLSKPICFFFKKQLFFILINCPQYQTLNSKNGWLFFCFTNSYWFWELICKLIRGTLNLRTEHVCNWSKGRKRPEEEKRTKMVGGIIFSWWRKARKSREFWEK